MLLSIAIGSCQSQEKPITASDVLKENNIIRKNKFESKEGRFKADFPCEPMKSENAINSNYGNKTINFYECGNETARFTVSFQDFTKKVENRKRFFEDQKKQRVLGMEDYAKVALETEKTVDGIPAFYFETELNAGEMLPKSGLASELHLLKGQRYYSIYTMVLTKEGQKPNTIGKEIRDKTRQFIDSFEITEMKAGEQ